MLPTTFLGFLSAVASNVSRRLRRLSRLHWDDSYKLLRPVWSKWVLLQTSPRQPKIHSLDGGTPQGTNAVDPCR